MDSGTATKPTHILLLEDDRAHQDLVLRAFRDDPDQFRVSLAATVRQARDLIDRDSPDLIIADWILPDGKGLDILPRTDGKVTIPLIIMTSFGDEHLAVEIMKSGAIDYVVKSATVFRDLPHIARRALRDWENIRERKRAEEAVQETQKRLVDILGLLPDAVFAIDIEGRVIAWNNAIERLTGVSAADMLGKDNYAYSIPFYSERRPILIDLVLTDNAEVEKKYDFITRDGHRLTTETFVPSVYGGKGAYLWGTASPLFDNNRNRTGSIEVIRDITERKRGEEAVAEQKAILETLLNAPGDTITLLDRQGIIISSNEENARRLGGTVQSVTGRCAYDFFPGDIATVRKAHIDNVFEAGKREIFDDERAGRFLHTDIFPIFNPEHTEVDRVAIFSRDITDQKKGEQALAESERKYRFLIDNIRDIVWQTTPDLTFTYLSPSTEIVTGYRPEDLLGTSFFGILTDPSVRVVRDRLRNRMEDYSRGSRDLATVFEAGILKKDGGLLWLEISSNAVFDPEGTITGFQGIGRDITDRKRAEKALVDSEVRFRDLFSNMSAGVVIYEPTPDAEDFIIRDLNRAAETIEKVKKTEIIGRTVLEVFPGVVEFGLFAVFQRVAKTGIAESHPVSLYHDNRIAGWRENHVYKLPSGEVVAIYEDVTEKKQAEEKLRESEGKYRGLYDSMRDAFATADMNGRITLFNEPFQKMVGYEKDEIYNLTYDDLTPDKWHSIEADIIRNQVFANGYSGIYEKEYRRKDGTVFPVELRTFLVKDDAGNTQSMSAVIRDITERKQVEEALQVKEYQLSTIYRNTSEVLFFLSVEQNNCYRFLTVNQSFLDITGLPQEQIVGKYVHEVIPEPSLTLVLEKYKQAIQDNTTITWEEITEYPAGKKWGEVRVTPLTDATGRCTNLVGSVHDITERKLAEDKLRESEEKFRSMVETSPDMIWEIDNQGSISYISSQSSEQMGYPQEDLIGKPFFSLVQPEYIPAIKTEFFSHVQGKSSFVTLEVPAKRRDGSRCIIEIRSVPITGADGQLKGFRGIARDVTERKLAEDKLRESEERYRALLFGAGIGVGYWSTDGTLLLLNDISLKRLKGTEKDFIGKTMRELFVTDADMYLDRIRKAALSSDLMEYEDYISLPIGKGWYLSVYTRITGPDGSVMGIQVLSMDITERRQVEDALRESRQILEGILNTIPARVFWKNKELTYLGCNTAFARDAGFEKPGDLIGRDDYSMGWREQAELYRADDRAVIESGKPKLMIEEPQRTPAGETIYLLTSKVPLLDGQGDVTGILGTYLDITERKRMEEQLRASEIKFRTVADYTYDWEYWLGEDGQYRYVSPSCERITGYPPDAFYRDPSLMETIIHPDDLGLFRDHIASRETAGVTETITEFRIIARDGSMRWIGHLCRPITSSTGKFLGRRGSNRDITERKLTESALRESETRYSALIQNSSDIIRILDRDGRIVYESPSSERILGYSPGFMIGRNPMEYIHPDDLGRVKNDFQAVLDKANTGTPTEFRIRKADGEFIWVDSIGTNLLDVPGVNGIVITTRPIQQRKEAEQALNESEERLRLALEGADIASWDWDLTSGNAVFSDRFYTMLDYEPGEFPATYDGWAALIHPDDRERVLPDLNRQIQEKRPLCEIEYRLMSKDGNWIWILGRGKIACTDNKGKPTRLTGVNIDITNRRLMESEIRSLNTVLEQRVKDRTEALAKTNKELGEEVAQRHEAERRLKGSYDEKVMLLKEIHHRVKNNLQIIASLLNLQSRYITDEKTLAAIRESQNRVKAMALVHEKLYRAEDIAHISLYDYVRFLGTGLFQFYDAKNAGIQFSLDISDVNVDIDAAIPLGLILNELISNSLKYAFPEGRKGEVAISVKKEGHTITVQYRDTGIGIPADLDWRDTQSLGLRLVNTLVDQMNGTVELDRTSGTLFTMVLHEKEPREQP